jgi:hypothetical protein
MSIVLLGSTSGSVTLQEQAVAGTSVLTLPVGTGTVVANNVNSAIVSGTSVSASSTSVDFTGIPSWVKRITVMFNGVSTNGSSIVQIQIGSSSGIVSTGYFGLVSVATSANTFIEISTGIPIQPVQASAASYSYVGNVVFTNISGNIWTANGNMGSTTYGCASSIGGVTPALAGVLDRVRITTVNGTDTFDAGSINILYE